MPDRTRSGPLFVALVIGIGLVAAPAIFQMFSRAPMGASMIDDFRPYMTPEQVSLFQGHLETIDAANAEHISELKAAIVGSGPLNDSAYGAEFPSAVGLDAAWPAIVEDMGDLLARMDNNIDNYEAMDALPNFKLFPWFFVFPGLMIAGLAAWALMTRRASGAPTQLQLRAIVIMGVAVIAAPGIFQMFSRAPLGGDMINDFRPMMTRDRVLAVQSYFITLGSAEGELRNSVIPMAGELQGASSEQLARSYPDVSRFSEQWPSILTDFAPMIATMSDNVDNFAAVDAMPPFPLFPWFFVFPGLLVAGAGVTSIRGGNKDSELLAK